MAKKARVALAKMDNVENVMVDTTARGVIKMKKGKAPTVDAINKALGRGLKVSAVTKSSRAVAHEIYEISVTGLA